MFQYKTRFDNIVTASLNFDNNVLLSQASLEPLKGLMPDSVNLEKNVDLVGAAFNAAVVNKFNKNGDGIDTNTAIAFKEYFIHKPTNIEHKKQKVVGHIVNSGFSSYENNKVLSDAEVGGSLNPFNIALAAVVYKTVDREFADALVESNESTSNLYEKISASWEIGFNDYFVAVGSEDLKEADIITDKKQIEEFKKYMKGFSGNGFMNDGTPVYRLVTGRIYPLGIGFTTNPAADVEGVVVDDGKNNNIQQESDAIKDVESIHVNSLELLKINNNFSQNKKSPVKINKNNIMDLEQILTELKTVLAEKRDTDTFSDEAVANISQKIAESIKEKSDEIQAKISAAEEAKLEAVAEADQLKKDRVSNSEKLDEALSKINELESTLSAQGAQELFNSRMSLLDADYDFEDADRKILSDELKDLDSSDEAFASYQEKVGVIFAHKSKDYIKAQQEKFDAAVAEAVEKKVSSLEESKASTEEAAAEVNLEEVLDEAQETTPEIANTNEASSGEAETLKSKFQSAFSKENIKITY